MCTNAETKVTTTSITELKGSILIDQLATKFPELIHSNNIKLPYVLVCIPFQNKIIENTAEIHTNKLVVISEKYSLFSNKLNFIYNDGFESMMFYDSKKEFELSILPQLDGNKQIYLFSKNAGQFFYAQKISKHMKGGALIGKGSFRKFNDYDMNIKDKDFSIDKN